MSPPFYERRGFQGTVAVVGLATAIWALLGAPRPWDLVAAVFSTESVALSNTEIVLDTSSAMAGRFEGDETKFDAAVRAIRQSGQRDDEGLALRRTSPGCEGDGDLLVDFGTDQKDEVLGVAGEQSPEGRSNIAQAVIEAVGDFRTNPEFSGPRSTRRVLVFTAGRDDCFEGDVAGKIRAELKDAEISASFTLIALNASELKWLDDLKDGLESAEAFVEFRAPRTERQLDRVVEDVRRQSREAIEDREAEEAAEEAEEELQETISG